MKVHEAFLIVLLGLLLLSSLLIGFASFATPSPNMTITTPQLANGQFSTVPDTFYESVVVNVTSNVPILNVTIYYHSFPIGSEVSIPTNVSNYNHALMNPSSVNGTYYYQIPPQPNNTEVVAEAQAFGANYSRTSSFSGILYEVVTPPPRLNLTMSLDVIDVEPKFMGVTLSIFGGLYNAERYNSYFDWYANIANALPPFSKQSGVFYSYTNYTNIVAYSSGEPNLFPFDSYNCTFYIYLPTGWNISSVIFDQPGQVSAPTMVPDRPYAVPTSGNFSQRTDLSGWNISPTAVYLPSSNSSISSRIRVTILLTSRSSEYMELFVIPVFSIFALLGSSIILQSDNDTTNRIAIYLTVVVFAFGFFAGMRNLATFPETIGLTMIERLTLALIPSTVSLGFFSMIGVSLKRFRLLLDAFAVLSAFILTFYLTSFMGFISTPPYRTSFNFLSLGMWSTLFVLALSGGFLIALALSIWRKYRSKSKWPWQRGLK